MGEKLICIITAYLLSILGGSVSPSTLGEGGGAHIIIHSVSSSALVEVGVCIIPSVLTSSSTLSVGREGRGFCIIHSIYL